jgi:histidine ammonia-lyase
MLLRANSLIKGASGIRLEIIERYATFLNANAVPHVFQRGSIGASGDLVPFSYIAGAILGARSRLPRRPRRRSVGLTHGAAQARPRSITLATSWRNTRPWRWTACAI